MVNLLEQFNLIDEMVSRNVYNGAVEKTGSVEQAEVALDYFQDIFERNLFDLADGISSHSLKMCNPRADKTASFLVWDGSGGDYFYTSGMTKFMPHQLIPLLTNSLQLNGKHCGSFIDIIFGDNIELKTILLKSFSEFLSSKGCSKNTLERFIQKIEARRSQIHELPLVSNETGGSAYNVPIVYMPHDGTEVLVTPLVSIGEHIAVSNVHRLAVTVLLDLRTEIESSLNGYLTHKEEDKGALLDRLQLVVSNFKETIPYIDGQLELLFVKIYELFSELRSDDSLKFSSVISEIKGKLIKKSGSTTNIINKEMYRFSNLVDFYKFSDQPQNITNALAANQDVKRRYRLKADFPSDEHSQEYVRNSRFVGYLNGEIKEYPLIQNNKIGELVSSIYNLLNRGRNLYKPEKDSLARLVGFCEKLVNEQIRKTNEVLDQVQYENELQDEYTCPANWVEVLPFVNFKYVKTSNGVTSKDLSEFVVSPAAIRIFQKGY